MPASVEENHRGKRRMSWIIAAIYPHTSSQITSETSQSVQVGLVKVI